MKQSFCALDKQQEDVFLRVFKDMLTAREADRREDILFRQGRGQFHVASTGHEALAVLAVLMEPEDWIFSHYRDKALMLARGMSLEEISLGFFAKGISGSGGRQLVDHYCNKGLNVAPSATPTGLQCLPAAGVAWGLHKQNLKGVVFCNLGDASTRQGEFFEAVSFARQEKLRVIFVVEDNGIGISTPTESISPLALGMLNAEFTYVVNGRSAKNLLACAEPIIKRVRDEGGPAILWVKVDRLVSHTGSDDQTKYRSVSDIEEMRRHDPIEILRQELVESGYKMFVDGWSSDIGDRVKEVYRIAENHPDPDTDDVASHIFSSSPTPKKIFRKNENVSSGEWSMAEAVNEVIDTILSENPYAQMFGEDIEDGKGGVFGLTKGLSTKYPGRVKNSPLAEATIAGLASGLSMTGVFPIFEFQFIDFVGPAFNQIINQIATLSWRSKGQYKCPLIMYAPCGSYISGGGPWHSQTNEAWFVHAPGLKVYMPGNANDAANLMYSAAHGEDPVLILLPKNQFQRRVARERDIRLHPERARVLRKGNDVTIVSWGNTSEITQNAADVLHLQGVDAEIIDLCSIVPCDYQSIFSSIRKTGRLVVVQEDNRSCSFGQAIISEACADYSVWNSLYAPPALIARDDVHIGFSRVLETSVLPNVSDVVRVVNTTMGGRHV